MRTNPEDRPQVTAHIDAPTRRWLDRYAKVLKLKPSELVRLLIRREQEIRWLEKCIGLPDEQISGQPPKPTAILTRRKGVSRRKEA